MQRNSLNNNNTTTNNSNGGKNNGSGPQRRGVVRRTKQQRNSVFRHDAFGQTGHVRYKKKNVNCESLTYVADESDVWRAHEAMEHYMHRGDFWNAGKHFMIGTYSRIALTGIFQACVAYATNITSNHFIDFKFKSVGRLLEEKAVVRAFLQFYFYQLVFAAMAGICVWIQPISGGSGIPEVKCYLNGIDLPTVLDIKTLFCKVIGVTASVSAGLPVGKEGPMVHSGAVVANLISSGNVKNDRQKRDMVSCGAAAGVCTAFSAPIGGILFALEEGASYWSPSLTWRTFFCSMTALATLYSLNSIGSAFGKVGFNKLFSFGNFEFGHDGSSYAMYEMIAFVLIGAIGGLIGAIFNNANEVITHWRMTNINKSKQRRFMEVLFVSSAMSVVMFFLPLAYTKCTPIPTDNRSEEQMDMWEKVVPFLCEPGTEYNELASLIFTDPGDSIRLLFHLHKHAFSTASLLLFFFFYITLAVVTYGIAVPSGLFVPSLLSGAAFGRLVGNLAHKIYPNLAYSNTYALIGAAAVLGGMARMTISLTVILLECTGNEQFALPLMLTLMTARITGSLFNEDLYHIHIHMKKGVEFLEAELRSVTRQHNLVAGQIMGANVIFLRPVEKVGIIYDILKSSKHSNYPVVDTDDKNILFGTIGRNALCVLLQKRAFGYPADASTIGQNTPSIMANYLQIGERRYFPLIQWEILEKSYPKYPSVFDLRVTEQDRDQWVDLRPYANTAAVSVQETSSVHRTYSLFRSLGLRFLPVVNKYNQVVGTITRSDLTADALAQTMLEKGKRHIDEVERNS
ncbi:chloride channel [Nitzschia inconspicua]|uniref:Chloride channel n=1 Tax=Nitzschia inconspicua TaxID=303405 RepID=A0A9K3M693_9STRA|nr:chloride channel [Nitzschia inconspicua]